MTLIIARRIANRIQLLSDSRLSFSGSDITTDIGIKIFSIPVNVFTPTDSQTKKKLPIYQKDIGIAVCGQTLNAYLLKETLYEVFKNLQIVPERIEFSLDLLCGLVNKFFKHTSTELSTIFKSGGFSAFFLVGYCTSHRRNRAFIFEPVMIEGVYEFIYKETLLEEEIKFLGSGQRAAEVIFESGETDPSKIMRAVIKDESEISVGGNIQYGVLERENFDVLGVTDYTKTEDGEINYVHTLRGVELYIGEFEPNMDDLIVSFDFFEPFKNEPLDYLRKQSLL